MVCPTMTIDTALPRLAGPARVEAVTTATCENRPVPIAATIHPVSIRLYEEGNPQTTFPTASSSSKPNNNLLRSILPVSVVSNGDDTAKLARTPSPAVRQSPSTRATPPQASAAAADHEPFRADRERTERQPKNPFVHRNLSLSNFDFSQCK